MSNPSSNNGQPEGNRLTTLRVVLSLFPGVVAASTLENGFWLGLAMGSVLFGSLLLIRLIDPLVTPSARRPVLFVIMATLAAMAEMMMRAYMSEVNVAISLYLLVIVANGLILDQLEERGGRQPFLRALTGGLRLGALFLFSLLAIGAVRELISTGNLVLLGRPLLGGGLPFSVSTLRQPAGAFLLLGVGLAGKAAWEQRSHSSTKAQPAQGAGAKGVGQP